MPDRYGNCQFQICKSSGFPTRPDTNPAVQPQKIARGLEISDMGSRGNVLSV